MNRIRPTSILSGLAVLGLLLLSVVPAARAQAPETITYQGYLTDGDGVPLGGSANLAFRLYDAASGGNVLWAEDQTGVPLTNGVFSVRLGAEIPLGEVALDRPTWLAVSVNGGAELAPRVALEAVPFAMNVRGLRVVPGSTSFNSPNLIGGHPDNSVAAGVGGATIGGGGSSPAGPLNLANTILSNGAFVVIGGGAGNRADAPASTIGGGLMNETTGSRSTIGGGEENAASGDYAFIGGGRNHVADGEESTIGGGLANSAEGKWATVGGGWNNGALNTQAVISGGDNNVADGLRSSVGGGGFNAAHGVGATVPGGQSNVASGDNSLAAGFNARADHDGTFVWADYVNLNSPAFASTGDRQFLIRAQGGVGIGTNAPLAPVHVASQPLGFDATGLSDDVLLIEGDRPVIGIYGMFQQNTRPGLVLAGVNENGTLVDKWGIVRQFFGTNSLLFTYGLGDDHTQNTTIMSLSSTSGVTADRFTAQADLGANGTPTPGGHFRDNVVYAWADVLPDGTVRSSYGCTVSKITGTGSYQVNFKRTLPNGTSAVVTVQTLNDPVIATATASQNSARVATKVFNGTTFVAADYGFFIQVVGRP